jgi:DNA-binding transcriptional LysR family regulator
VPSLATEWLVPRLEEFYLRHPDIELFLRAEFVPATVERAEDEGIDIFIQYQQEPSEDLEQLGSLQELIFPVCSRSYREQHFEAGLPRSGITRFHDVWLDGSQHFEWEEWLKKTGLWSDVPFKDRSFNLAHLAYHAALGGQGVAIGRAILVNRLITKGELVPVNSAKPVRGAKYRVSAYRPGGPRSPTRLFAAWLMESMRETQKNTILAVSGEADLE